MASADPLPRKARIRQLFLIGCLALVQATLESLGLASHEQTRPSMKRRILQAIVALSFLSLMPAHAQS
jgi:hypothetical protein